MYDRAPVLARNLDFLTTQDDRKNTRRRRPLKADRTLQVLVADLVAARGCGYDAGGSRRQNVDHQERRFAPGERGVYSSDVEHHREICARGGRTG